MHCPFCDREMRLGTIRVNPLRHFYASVTWEPDLPSSSHPWWKGLIFDLRADHARSVLAPGLLRRSERVSSYCDGCGAVLAHPRDEAATSAE